MLKGSEKVIRAIDKAQKQAYIENRSHECEHLNTLLKHKFDVMDKLLFIHQDKQFDDPMDIFFKEISMTEIQHQVRKRIPTRQKPTLHLPCKMKAFFWIPGAERRYYRLRKKAFIEYRNRKKEYDNYRENQKKIYHDIYNKEIKLKEKWDNLKINYESGKYEGMFFLVQKACRRFDIADYFDFGDATFDRKTFLDVRNHECVINIRIPCADELVGDAKRFRFVKNQDEIRPIKISRKEKREHYENFMCQLIIVMSYDIFDMDYAHQIEAIYTNIICSGIDPANGHLSERVLLSVFLPRSRFDKIKIDNINPIECIKSFGARMSSNPLDRKGVMPYKPTHAHELEKNPDVSVIEEPWAVNDHRKL